MLEGTRHTLGVALTWLGLKEFTRRIYIAHARWHVRKHRSRFVGAWVRRSLVTEDFVPVASDIDLTVLISIDRLEDFPDSGFLKTILIRDTQIVVKEFLDPWLETGGFRNRQIPAWLSLIHTSGNTLRDVPPDADHALAFDLAQEAFLLYRQIETHRSSPELSRAEAKLWREIERLRVYWHTRDPEVLMAPRKLFELPEGRSELLGSLEAFSEELLKVLPAPLADFTVEPLIKEKGIPGSDLYLEVLRRPVFLLEDLSVAASIPREKFLVTRNFLRLLKGTGIQEQTLLNRAAREIRYYRNFNRQRLAHDLVQALILEPKNTSQIFYCFKNIDEFLSALGAESEAFTGLPERREDLLALSRKALQRLRDLG